MLCCNHEPVRLTPNNNKPRCDYHRFTARVAINNKISVGFGIFFIGCLRNARTSPTYTNLHTTLTDITYRHHLPTLLTYAITYIRVFQHSKTSRLPTFTYLLWFFSIQKPVAYLHLLTYYGFSAFKNQSYPLISSYTYLINIRCRDMVIIYENIQVAWTRLAKVLIH